MKTKNILLNFSLGLILIFASCGSENSDISSPVDTGVGGGSGTGGSMARFTIAGNRLFLLSQNDLHAFDLSGGTVTHQSKQQVGTDIETIFPYKNYLFIGSTNGMYIYDQATPAPSRLSVYTHVVSCDPVIADSTFAYVTLRTGTTCWGTVNQLEVIDISNVTNPVLKNAYTMTQPRGLGKKGNLLYVCDGDNLKVMDASNPNALTLKYSHPVPEAYDVIPVKDFVIVSAKDGIYQMRYNGTDFTQLSKIK